MNWRLGLSAPDTELKLAGVLDNSGRYIKFVLLPISLTRWLEELVHAVSKPHLLSLRYGRSRHRGRVESSRQKDRREECR